MTATAILNFFNPQKLPHTTVDIPTKWIIIWLPKHGYQFPTSKSIWKPIFAQIGGFLYFVGHFGFQMATIANQQWISNLNFIIYLETKFRPNRGFFVFWQPFWIQNGHHSKPTMNINSQHQNLLGNQILYLGYHGNSRHFEKNFNPPKAATHYGGYSYKFS
jgi:hypothetical protein